MQDAPTLLQLLDNVRTTSCVSDSKQNIRTSIFWLCYKRFLIVLDGGCMSPLSWLRSSGTDIGSSDHSYVTDVQIINVWYWETFSRNHSKSILECSRSRSRATHGPGARIVMLLCRGNRLRRDPARYRPENHARARDSAPSRLWRRSGPSAAPMGSPIVK